MVSYEEGSLDQYLRDISIYPLITREDEVALAQKIRVGDQDLLVLSESVLSLGVRILSPADAVRLPEFSSRS